MRLQSCRNAVRRWVADRQGSSGQVLVIFALFLFVLIGFVALSVDAGFLMAERRQAQAAADGAAMAADKAYQRNELANIDATGKAYAWESGGFTAAEVTINPMPVYNGYERCVEALITHEVTSFFVGAIYNGPWEVSTRGVACTDPEVREYALIALNPNGSGINAGGTADVVITNDGGAMSNADADYCGSLAWLQAQGPLDAVGGIDLCNNANVDSLPPNPAAAAVEDPLAGVAEPSCAGMDSFTQTNPAAPDQYATDPLNALFQPDVDVKSNDPFLQGYRPGYYPNGVKITGDHDVVFLPGLYCFGGNGLKLSGGASADLDVVGVNVLFYFEAGAMLDINGQGIDVNISNNGSACSQDACQQEIIVFYTRTAGYPDSCSNLVPELRLNGNDVSVTGILYAPCSLISLEGNGNLDVTGQVLGGEIKVAGGNQVTVNYVSSLVTAPSQVYLVD